MKAAALNSRVCGLMAKEYNALIDPRRKAFMRLAAPDPPPNLTPFLFDIS